MTSIFLSHNVGDKPFVRRLARDLARRGAKVWLDEAEIKVGDSLIEKIQLGIDDMDFLGVVLSRRSATSEWVKREVDVAMNREIAARRVKVLPLMIEDCELPGFLLGKKFADFRDDKSYGDALGDVLRAMGVDDRLDFEPETVLIPAGSFIMGSDLARDEQADPDEQPQHSLHLDEYALGRTPVTIAQYAVFVRETARKPPVTWHNYDPALPPQERVAEYPVTRVSWYDALAYCQWLSEATGRRYLLPSEAEWEKGARGEDGRIYPWGNRWSDDRCHAEDRRMKPSSVEVFRYGGDVSPYGLQQMAGNVEEWTRSLWGPAKVGAAASYLYPYDPKDGRENLKAPKSIARVVRGGSFFHKTKACRCAFRNANGAAAPASYVGIRVCMKREA